MEIDKIALLSKELEDWLSKDTALKNQIAKLEKQREETKANVEAYSQELMCAMAEGQIQNVNIGMKMAYIGYSTKNIVDDKKAIELLKKEGVLDDFVKVSLEGLKKYKAIKQACVTQESIPCLKFLKG